MPMPVFKILPSKSSPRSLEKYIKNPDKTEESLWYGNLCIPEEIVTDQFREFNELVGRRPREDDRSHYHLIVSYNTGPGKDNMTPEQCRDLSVKILDRCGFSRFPYLLTVHTDKDTHLHAHIMLSATDVRAKQFHHSKADLKHMKELANEVCLEAGYCHSYIDQEKTAKVKLSAEEAQMLLKDEIPWKVQLRYQIDQALDQAADLSEFKKLLYKEGITLIDTPTAFRYLMPGQEKPCPERRLGSGYTKSYIESMLQQKQREFDQRELETNERRKGR